MWTISVVSELTGWRWYADDGAKDNQVFSGWVPSTYADAITAARKIIALEYDTHAAKIAQVVLQHTTIVGAR